MCDAAASASGRCWPSTAIAEMTSPLGLSVTERLVEFEPRLADRRLPPETVTVPAHAIELLGVQEAVAPRSTSATQLGGAT
jgi:hypothetical protein